MLTDSKRKRWYQMPISNTCKEVGKNQSFIYYPSLGYKRKNEAFVIEKSFLKSCPYGEKHRGISPCLSREKGGWWLVLSSQVRGLSWPRMLAIVRILRWHSPRPNLWWFILCIISPWVWVRHVNTMGYASHDDVHFITKGIFFFHSSLGLVEFIKCKIILDGPCLRR